MSGSYLEIFIEEIKLHLLIYNKEIRALKLSTYLFYHLSQQLLQRSSPSHLRLKKLL